MPGFSPRFVFRSARLPVLALTLAAVACGGGGFSCMGCGGGLTPIPGGFPDSSKIDRAVQARFTRSGLDFLQTSFGDLVSAYAGMTCGTPTDLPCPTGFHRGGQPLSTSCSAMTNVCVDNMAARQPVLGFEINQTVSSGATVCRDDPADPNRRRCIAYLLPENLALQPMPPDKLQATISAQIYTTPIPLRYDPLGMDCLVTLDSSLSGSNLQDFTILAQIGAWSPPAGGAGRQLEVNISNLMAMIPDGDVHISVDPINGDFLDIGLCAIGNLSLVKGLLIPQLTGKLSSTLNDQVHKLLGWKCNAPNTDPCPAQTHCNSDNLCEEDRSGKVVPQKLGIEGRADLASLAGFSGANLGSADLSILVGGSSPVDMTGLNLGVLGGMEAAQKDLSCAMDLPSPRTRPGFVSPAPLPQDGSVDLNFDGTPETPYMLAAGVSQAMLDQLTWSIYEVGAFCQSISSYEVDLINTGSLSVLMPSLDKLTHKDKFNWSVWPARIRTRAGQEPRIQIGSGKISGAPMMPHLDEPLLEFQLPGFELDFSAMIEERWVHLMTVQADIKVPLGIYATPSNAIELLIGDLQAGLTNVHVTDAAILEESTADLEAAVPSLISLVLPQLTGRLAPSFSLPPASQAGGFIITMLGARGISDGMGGYPEFGLYLNLGFDPSQVHHLELAAETVAEIRSLRIPSSEELSVRHAGGPVRPQVELTLGGLAPAGQRLEHQVRIDRGLWSAFFEASTVTLDPPELLVQGHHHLEVRARIAGDYRTLDPTPVSLDLLIDTEAPVLHAQLDAPAGGAHVRARDAVSGDRVRLELGVAGEWREIHPDADDFVAIPGLGDATLEIAIRATDEAGLSSQVVLRPSAPLSASSPAAPQAQDPRGCRCVSSSSDLVGVLTSVLIGLALHTRRKKAEQRDVKE